MVAIHRAAFESVATLLWLLLLGGLVFVGGEQIGVGIVGVIACLALCVQLILFYTEARHLVDNLMLVHYFTLCSVSVFGLSVLYYSD